MAGATQNSSERIDCEHDDAAPRSSRRLNVIHDNLIDPI